jgi:hypothetical protein
MSAYLVMLPDTLIYIYNSLTSAGDSARYWTKIYPLESSGGGVMVIHETVSGGTHTLDKTWQEIHDFDGISVVISDTPDGDGTMRKFDSVINVKDDPAYTVITGDYIEYTASSASGYPSYTE